jgi:hypothetical protein
MEVAAVCFDLDLFVCVCVCVCVCGGGGVTAFEYSGTSRPPNTNLNSHQPSLRPEQRTARSEPV